MHWLREEMPQLQHRDPGRSLHRPAALGREERSTRVAPKTATLNTRVIQAVTDYSQVDCDDRSRLLPPLLPRIAELPFVDLHRRACALIGSELGNDDVFFPH